MRNVIKATLVTAITATVLAGASVAFAAGMDGSKGGFTGKNDMSQAPGVAEKNMMIDDTTTGSISNGSDSSLVSKDCISQQLDAAGVCIVDKSM